MENAFELLYVDMLADISRCLELEHPEKENIESCFWIAKNYWEKLQNSVTSRIFGSEHFEIAFYRIVKPKFASYIEYFSLLSEGLMFVPPWIPFPEILEGKIDEAAWCGTWQESINDYWRQEEVRGNRFYKKNQEFIDYCENGNTDHDAEYFLVRNRLIGEMSPRRTHNRDTDLFTVHEEILTTWEAYKLYSAYIKKKVSEPVGS